MSGTEGVGSEENCRKQRKRNEGVRERRETGNWQRIVII
jgi:hypothetical protein